MPPQLRPYLFTKGGGRGKSSGGSRSSSPRGRGAASKAYHHAKSKFYEWTGVEARPVQMGISAGFGFILDKFLDRLGAAQALLSTFPGLQPFFDKMYATAPNGWRNDSLSHSGNKGLATVAGGIAGLSVMYDGATKGKLSSKDVNFKAPFAIGQYFDAPEGGASAPMGHGALGGLGGAFSGGPMSGLSQQASGAGWC